jgi:hypothetical protein
MFNSECKKPFLDLEHCRNSYEQMKIANERNMVCRHKASAGVKQILKNVHQLPLSDLERLLKEVEMILENP